MALRSVPADTAVVRIAGEDAAAFLQGQCTADLRGAALTDALWLNRKGRVLAHTVVAKEA
ncbi:MAG: Aminomethyltransferase folate-binding domain, partial [Verrucomicrobiota bacterium]